MQPEIPNVFIMSSERSGSNLLRRILGTHHDLASPPPPHFLRLFSSWLPAYGDLRRDDAFRELLTDMLELTRVPNSHLRWSHELGTDEVLGRVQTRSLTGAVAALYESFALRESKRRWVCKENNIFDFAFELALTVPRSKFIYLVRDGRDVACSIRNIPSHDQAVPFIAKEWRSEQMACIRAWQTLVALGKCTLVRYEDLVLNPEAEVQRICGTIGLEFDPSMLGFYARSDSVREAKSTIYWRNLSRPVEAAMVGRFQHELSCRQTSAFEAVAGDALDLLGYPRQCENPKNYGLLRRSATHAYNRWHLIRQRRTILQEPGRAERQSTLRTIRQRRLKQRLSWTKLV